MGIPPPQEQTILVTGISGFVASHITRVFLNAGYQVRGTVRSEKSIPGIQHVHAQHADQLTFAVVPDIAAPGAFKDAAKGVSGIIHTANPFFLDLDPKDNENELLKPSIAGVLNVLQAAATQGPTLRRVVLTASFASMLDLSQGLRPGYTYRSSDWNPATYEEAKNSTHGGFTYCAAKALSEKAAWDWIATQNPPFSLAAINPAWIFGPSVGGLRSVDHLNESTEAIWNLVNGSSKTVPATDFAAFVDVRDVALAHLRAYELQEAGGERFVLGSHFDYQTAVDALRPEFPQLGDRIPEGTPGAGLTEAVYQVDGSKAEKVLGIKYTPLNITLKDTVEDLLKAEKKSSA